MPATLAASDTTLFGDVAATQFTVPLTGIGTISNGDLLLVLFSFNSATGDPTITVNGSSSSGWAIADSLRYIDAKSMWIWKVADTTESLIVDSTISRRASAVVLRFTGHDGVEFGTAANGNDTAPNSPSFAPAGGSKEYVWISACGFSGVSLDITAAPANYSGFIDNPAGSSAGIGQAVGFRVLTASSEDPGTFTGTGTNQFWVAHTAAVAPIAASAPTITDAGRAYTGLGTIGQGNGFGYKRF